MIQFGDFLEKIFEEMALDKYQKCARFKPSSKIVNERVQ